MTTPAHEPATATLRIPQRTTPDFAAEVLSELRALHWSSHGNGATTAEIVDALRIRGVVLPASDNAARWQVSLAMHGHVLRLSDANGDEVLRGDRAVYAPADPIETGVQYR